MTKKDYNHFNNAPEGLKIISKEEWSADMFEYQLGPKESRQVRETEEDEWKIFDLRMFNVCNNLTSAKIGIAIMQDWFDGKRKRNRKKITTRFCRYGTDEEWRVFKSKFAAQFANDNN